MPDFVPDARPLGPGEVYMPPLGRHVLPLDAPVQMIRFAARFRALFESEINVPKELDIDAQFGSVADHLHFNKRDLAGTNTWRFQRFAPAWALRIGQDLTGESVLDERYAPFNTRLLEMLEQAVERGMPFYAANYLAGTGVPQMVHRLLIPVSTTASTITHCLVFTFS